MMNNKKHMQPRQILNHSEDVNTRLHREFGYNEQFPNPSNNHSNTTHNRVSKPMTNGSNRHGYERKNMNAQHKVSPHKEYEYKHGTFDNVHQENNSSKPMNIENGGHQDMKQHYQIPKYNYEQKPHDQHQNIPAIHNIKKSTNLQANYLQQYKVTPSEIQLFTQPRDPNKIEREDKHRNPSRQHYAQLSRKLAERKKQNEMKNPQ